jgi:transcriptional regulator with XRE-family HTH domain
MGAPTVENRVTAVLRRRQWSRTDLAAGTELPYAVVRRIVRRGSNPPLEYALRIARVLDVPVETLFALDPAGARRGGPER